jgi:hypothetical protein
MIPEKFDLDRELKICKHGLKEHEASKQKQTNSTTQNGKQSINNNKTNGKGKDSTKKHEAQKQKNKQTNAETPSSRQSKRMRHIDPEMPMLEDPEQLKRHKSMTYGISNDGAEETDEKCPEELNRLIDEEKSQTQMNLLPDEGNDDEGNDKKSQTQMNLLPDKGNKNKGNDNEGKGDETN